MFFIASLKRWIEVFEYRFETNEFSFSASDEAGGRRPRIQFELLQKNFGDSLFLPAARSCCMRPITI